VNHYSNIRLLLDMIAIELMIDRQPIRNNEISKKSKKNMNLPKLILPTQLLIQVQWWSYCLMQTLQISQW